MIKTTAGGRDEPHPGGGNRQRLRYGLNGTVSRWQFATGPQRARVRERIRAMGTHAVRLSVFDNSIPNPLGDWELLASCAQAVLDVGAVPMISFAKFGPPYDDAGAVRAFAGHCAGVVAACIRQWGGEVVRNWYWGVWHHPNSEWISAGLTFDHYRRIYEETATAVLARLSPFLEGRRPRIGGPAADGFQPFWKDWVWRFVNEIDNDLIGFASWHHYGDWREVGAWGAPTDEATFRALLMARVSEYESRARAVARMLKGRDILNVCGELNAHAHHEPHVSGAYNRTVFGAAYYASALVHLMRGGADLELLNAEAGGHWGPVDDGSEPNPVLEAKRLCARSVCLGDLIRFPEAPAGQGLDVVVAEGEWDRRSILIVHRNDEVAACAVEELTGGLSCGQVLLKIDRGTEGRVVEERFNGCLRLDGYGVAVVTTGSAVARGERR
jgi:hypothetical protein